MPFLPPTNNQKILEMKPHCNISPLTASRCVSTREKCGVGTKKKQQSMSFFYLVSSYELFGYFLWFAVNKSLCIEVFHTGLVYYQWRSRMHSYWSACKFTKIWTPSDLCINDFNEPYQIAYLKKNFFWLLLYYLIHVYFFNFCCVVSFF